MHPDGVFVFLSLLIYGGLLYTQKKNLHFNFHYFFLSSEHSSSGRELVFWFPPTAPHCSGTGEDTGTGLLQALLHGSKAYADKIYLCLCRARTPGMFGPISQSFLHTVMKGEGNSPVSFLAPNTGPCLHTYSEKHQPSKEQGQLGTLTPLPSPLLQGWQEDRQKALGTHPFLVSCRVVPVLRWAQKQTPIQHHLKAYHMSWTSGLHRDPKDTISSRLHLYPSCKPWWPQ